MESEVFYFSCSGPEKSPLCSSSYAMKLLHLQGNSVVTVLFDTNSQKKLSM